jgi:hypothetical protein
MTDFTPVSALIGGGLIGLAAAALMFTLGHIAGISGIAEETLPPWQAGEDNRWRLGFVLGIILAPLVFLAGTGHLPAAHVSTNPILLLTAGLLVGLGTSYGRGCTSGHGVCGLARLSGRSFVAVGLFLTFGMATVFVMRHI